MTGSKNPPQQELSSRSYSIFDATEVSPNIQPKFQNNANNLLKKGLPIDSSHTSIDNLIGFTPFKLVPLSSSSSDSLILGSEQLCNTNIDSNNSIRAATTTKIQVSDDGSGSICNCELIKADGTKLIIHQADPAIIMRVFLCCN